MQDVVIDVGELRSAYSEEIEELEKFLKEKLEAKIEVADREITLKPSGDSEDLGKDYIRVLLKRYLHRAELKDQFRVIAGKGNVLIIKERKAFEEGE